MLERLNVVLSGCVDSDRIELGGPINAGTVEQDGTLAMVVRHLRNARSKVAEKL